MSNASRRRDLPLRVVAAAAVTLAVGGCGHGDSGGAAATSTIPPAAVPAPATPRETTTIRLESQLAAPPRPAGGRSALPGTQLVFTGMLFKPHGTSAIGRSQGSCTRTAAGGGEVYQCLLSFIMRGGVIYAQSVASADGPAAGVVTGGTDRYEDMRGTFRFKATGNPRVDLTLALRQ
jgi:hypothetical protein